MNDGQNSHDSNRDEDFEFFLGEKVAIGSQSGIVTGQATYVFDPDQFQLLLVDEDGLPFKEWFDGHMISKMRNN